MAFHRVRVLRNGVVQTFVHIPSAEEAQGWAYAELQQCKNGDPNALWAATVESGRLLLDPFDGHDALFLPDNDVRDGLVLDRRMLDDPTIDLVALFGLDRRRL